jgi:glutamate---cysteine ligase / carboxylate-amine ligase
MSQYTVGVEEEYQLVDGVSGDLRSGARAVLAGDWSDDLRKEIQESTVEIGTRVCDSSAGIRGELRRLRAQTSAAAAAEDLAIVAAGLHPFGDWRAHQLTADDRYARMARTYGRIARDEHNFGMHIHVGLDGDRMPVLDIVRAFIPVVLALSCSSPFYEGADTGFDSYRTVLWRRWPSAGPPPRFGSEAVYRAYVDDLLRAGMIGDERNLYWMIRPHPQYQTLEFRMCDVCPRLEDAVAIAGLARVLVFAAVEGLLRPVESARWSGSAADAALADDCWRAARYGLDARLLIGNDSSGYEVARDAAARLLDTLRPAADALGEGAAFDGVAAVLARGNAASRLRAFHAECDDMPAVTRWLVTETLLGTGMDRRAERREPVDCD